QIETLIDANLAKKLANNDDLGRAKRIDGVQDRYVEFAKRTFPRQLSLDGVKVVVDCANGAGYKVAPRVLADLGADIIPVGCSPNGRNINEACGSTAPGLLQLTVPGVRAHVGIGLDGDGDRLIMVDTLGRIVDGDQLLYVIAKHRAAAGTLRGPVVGTVMSNFGLELALRDAGVEFRRAQVGDRYVLALLKETGGILGGETSGHLLCLDKATTGDAIVSALQVLAIMKETGRPLAELAAAMAQFPQKLINVRTRVRFDVESNAIVREEVAAVEKALAGQGRVVLRPSGTEPVIRVMVECRDELSARQHAERLARAVERAATT
ncbi:MAG: phosphoglucosamine mutase, partial [Steroidobacterales bacterium]